MRQASVLFLGIFTSLILLLSSSHAGELTQAQFPESLEGLTFSYPGPNCFGVAMYANKSISVVRGVDLKEFSAFVNSHCRLVDEPKRGDIGTFHNGSDFIHAFVYLGEGLVLEKTGVDYLGKTPIHRREISHTIYIFEASPECRRWGGDSKECYNTLEYYRCRKQPIYSDKNILLLEKKIEGSFAGLLGGQYSVKAIEILVELIGSYEEVIGGLNNPLLSGRLESFQKQLQFITQ